MCPLRLILIFLSATLAGFFVLKNLKSINISDEPAPDSTSDSSKPIAPANQNTSKVRATLENGFWTCVDMASGRYLWRNLVSATSSSSSASSLKRTS